VVEAKAAIPDATPPAGLPVFAEDGDILPPAAARPDRGGRTEKAGRAQKAGRTERRGRAARAGRRARR
jgi:penicillin-binding protein 2